MTRNEFIGRRLRRLGLHAPARVLELGCGGGAVATFLARAGYEVTGVDGHLSRVLEAARRAPNAAFIVHDLRDGVSNLGTGYDAVGVFDVIEHLDAPGAALRDAATLVRPGGMVVGTVPALMALWSPVDKRAGHRLRFSRTVLRDVPGVRVREVAYFNRSLVPLVWLRRHALRDDEATAAQVGDLAVPSAPTNWVSTQWLRLEHRVQPLLDVLHIPGASLWFALQRAE